MGTYPDAAVERAMKVQEVLLRAMSGQVSWWQAAEILGISDRSMRRWRDRLEKDGYDGLFDRRRQAPSPKRVPVATIEAVLRLYRTTYADCNVQHFHELLAEHHHLTLSYSWVKRALQTAGLVPRFAGRRPRGRRRRWNERWPNSASTRSPRIPRKRAGARSACIGPCKADGPRNSGWQASPRGRRPTCGWSEKAARGSIAASRWRPPSPAPPSCPPRSISIGSSRFTMSASWAMTTPSRWAIVGSRSRRARSAVISCGVG